MAKQILRFQKIAIVPATGLIAGTIYFETTTGSIKVAKSATEVEGFTGFISATLVGKQLTLKKAVGADVVIDLTSFASGLELSTGLSGKLNIGTAADAVGTQSYHGLKKDIAAAVGSVYRVKGTVANVAAITALTGVVKGDVYNISAAGTINEETFEAGSNFVAVLDGAGSQAAMWDKLGGTIDLSSYSKKPEVTSEIATKITTLDKADVAVAGQVVSAVSEVDGIISVSRRVLAEGDIPSGIPIAKVADLSTQLSSKVPKTTTVNEMPLSGDVVLNGTNIKVGGAGTYKAGSIEAAIVAMDGRIVDATASGVQSFAGKTGSITLETTSAVAGSVNLSMASNELQADIVGLKSAAFADKGEFDPAGSATTALASAKAYSDDLMSWVEFV